MNKWINSLLIITAVLILSLNNACQAPEKSPVAPPVSPAPAVKEPATTPPSSSASTTPSPQAASTLHINSVKITSPSRAAVSLYPPTVKPTENSIVSARVWETLDFECIAEDQAGHKLAYTWSCSAGKLRGEGSKVTWTAPGAGGDYTVVINVTCDKGESDVLTFKVTVKCCSD